MAIKLYLVYLTSCLLILTGGGITFAQHHGHHDEDYSVMNDLECYACIYVEGNANSTNSGCEKDKPPAEYKRKDCFGYGNIKVVSGMRHDINTDLHNNNGPYIVHCVTIKGKTDGGNKVIFRGCDYRNETYKEKTCFPDSDFPVFGIGTLRNVEKCFCNKKDCNGSNRNNLASLGILLPFILLFGIVDLELIK